MTPRELTVDAEAVTATTEPCAEHCARRIVVEERPGGITVERCEWCWRRHVRLVAEPGVIGLRLRP